MDNGRMDKKEQACRCSWDRVYRALAWAGMDELEAMLKEDQGAVIQCNFCSQEFKLDKAMLEQLIRKLRD